MSENTESPNQRRQSEDLPPLQDLALQQTPSATVMAKTEPKSEVTTPAASKYSNISFSIWPPTERTRDAVRNRLVETLSTPSVLSKRYGTIPREEAVDVAKRIEEEAFVSAGDVAPADEDGIEILQVYSKEISKRMLDAVKSRSVETVAPAAQPVNGAKAEEEDGESTAPPPIEKTESVADDK